MSEVCAKRGKRPLHKSERGFTLIEVIIAMTLAALITVLAAGILRTGLDYYNRAHNYIHQQQEIRGFLRVLRVELQSATPGMVYLSGDPYSVDYSTDSLPVAMGKAGVNYVNLLCREDESGHVDLVHRILLQSAPASKPPKIPGEKRLPDYAEEILVHRLSRCEFSYLVRDEKSTRPSASWLEKLPKGKAPPLAARVRLATASADLPPVVIPLTK